MYLLPCTSFYRKMSVGRGGPNRPRRSRRSRSFWVLGHCDPSAELLLACYASPYDVGAVLSHKDAEGEERPIAFVSRSLSTAERNYSQFEKEGLAIVFGIKKFHQYLCGRHFTITSVHKPLQHIFKESSPTPTMASARIQHWALLLGAYDYMIAYKPDRDHANADMLSRLPATKASTLDPPIPVETINLLDVLDLSPITSMDIKKWTAKDPTLSKLLTALVYNKHPPENVPHEYRKCWTELSVEQGCLLRCNRVVIPPQGQQSVMDLLHEGHPGMTRMKAVARSFVWWPRIDVSLETTIKDHHQGMHPMPNDTTLPTKGSAPPLGIPFGTLGALTY